VKSIKERSVASGARELGVLGKGGEGPSSGVERPR